MMIWDGSAFALGAVAGVLISTVYFAGLALGMQRALNARRAVPTLVFSAAVRIVAFLSAGWGVVTYGGPWAFAGYGIAFLICRRIATTLARVPVPVRGLK